MLPDDILAAAEAVLVANRAIGRRIATAESCTGGLVAGALTTIAGSSDVVEAGFVTYSNAAKTQLLAVDPAIFAAHGAVSRECALAMAAGALQHCAADVAVAITGVAGPGGGSPDKPVGLVVFARALRSANPQPHHVQRIFFQSTDRSAIRAAAVRHALTLLQPAGDALGRLADAAARVP
jgi:nicotinamide-nucleotide amidase